MSSAGKRRAENRYIQARYDALRATTVTLEGSTRAPFLLTEMSRRAEEAWRQQWVPHNDREPPNGGWDWPAFRTRLRGHIDRFEVAVWCGDLLCGLAIGTLSNSAAAIQAVEGSPVPGCPLKGDVLLIALQAVTCYAQVTGRGEVRIMEPAPALIPLYERGYGFALESPRRERPYCWRRV